MRQQQRIEFVKALQEDKHGPDINPTYPYLKGEEAKIKANTNDNEAKQSTTMHGED